MDFKESIFWITSIITSLKTFGLMFEQSLSS